MIVLKRGGIAMGAPDPADDAEYASALQTLYMDRIRNTARRRQSVVQRDPWLELAEILAKTPRWFS